MAEMAVRYMRMHIYMFLVVFTLLACVPQAHALTKEEIQGLSFLVSYQNDKRVKAAWQFLVNKKVIVVRPELQWQLAACYPTETFPEISAAIVTLQAAKILSVKPINWAGSANEVELLIDQGEIYPRALEMINRAQKSICFNIFLWGGEVGEKILDALVAAQARGVRVRVMTAPGSGFGFLAVLQKITDLYYGKEPEKPYRPVVEKAIEAGLDVVSYPVKKLNGKAFVKADHNKVLSIDGIEAMTGGMNFADVISSNHDTMVWLRGPAVTELEQIFEDNWRLCKGEEIENFPKKRHNKWMNLGTTGVIDSNVVVTYSNAFINATRGLVEQGIEQAKSKIRIMMFTFTDDQVVEKVIAAHNRGVDVEVLLDPNVHAFGLRLMGAPNLSTVRQFKKAGIPVRAYITKPGNQMHIKAAMIDDKYTYWGSTNWTKAGFDSNNETYVRVDSPVMAQKFNRLFEHDWKMMSYVLKSDGFGRWLLALLSELVDEGF